MSDYDYEIEADYSDPAPNPASAEADLVADYFPSSNGQVNYTDDTYLLDADEEELYEEEPYQPQPVNPQLAAEGLDMVSQQAFVDRLGAAAQPLATLAQGQREWAEYMASRAADIEERETREGMELAGSIVAQERQQGGLHMADDQMVLGAAEQIYQAALAGGLEDTPELGEASIRAAAQFLRDAEVRRAALLKA